VNNTVLASLIVGAVVVSAATAITVSSGINPWQKYAKVVAVEPAFETNRVPRQVCGDEAKLALAPTPAQPAGTPATTPTAGEKPKAAEKSSDGGDEKEGDCVVVFDTQSIQAGYDVTYELNGQQQVVRMDHDPGERIPVKNGELVVGRS
jgi:uncharacterized protein YcfJ